MRASKKYFLVVLDDAWRAQAERLANMQATVGTADHSDTSQLFMWNYN